MPYMCRNFKSLFYTIQTYPFCIRTKRRVQRTRIKFRIRFRGTFLQVLHRFSRFGCRMGRQVDRTLEPVGGLEIRSQRRRHSTLLYWRDHWLLSPYLTDEQWSPTDVNKGLRTYCEPTGIQVPLYKVIKTEILSHRRVGIKGNTILRVVRRPCPPVRPSRTTFFCRFVRESVFEQLNKGIV